MKKLPQQVAMSAEISHSVEQALNADGNNLRNNEEIVNYLNNLCTTLANAKELFNQTGFYDAVCKRVAKYVLSEVSSIRAVTYRILRKASQLPDDLSVLLNMHMDSFAIRSLELDANNSEERIEALKLCTMMLSHMNEKTKSSESGMVKKDYSNAVFPENICRALISIANCFFVIGSDRTKVEKKRDELAFSCFAVIIEQAVIAPGLILNSVDAGWIVEFFTNAIFNDHLSNLVCQILCAWLDSPQLRTQAKLRLVLNRIFASVIEIELFEQKGPIEFFLDYMGLNRSMHANNRKIRDLIIECCCEVLELPYSKTRFTNWLHTTYYYSTMFYPDAYKSSLRNEFILSEHEIYLKIVEQHSSVNDLLVSFRSVVAYLLINSNLIQTLSRIILRDPDDPVALRATLLMHDVLLASSTCLPMEWRLRILSLPTLIHNAYEVVSGTHISKKHPLNDDDYKLHKLIFTYAEQRNVIVLLNRLDILNSIALAQKTQPLPITNLQLFVQSSSTAIKLRKSKLSAVDFNHQEGDIDNVERALERLLFKAVESDGKLCWPVVDKLFQLLQSYYSCKDIFNFMTPAESSLIKFDDNRFIITCCCRAIHVSLLFAPREIQYKELLANFINDFIANISSIKDALLSGPLSLKNLVNTGAIYYFAFIGAVSAIKEGRKMLEATPLLDFSTKSLNSKDNISIKSKICRNVAM
ncbi:BMA-RICT-1, isoform b [Dirofilaria immitis]|nr:BMA-RICT-1, isoform b [Dirofilaria immitis]